MFPSLAKKPKPPGRPLNRSCSAILRAAKATSLSASFTLCAAALKKPASRLQSRAFTFARSLFRPSSIKGCFWPKTLMRFTRICSTNCLYHALRFIISVTRPIRSRNGHWRSLSVCWPITAKSIPSKPISITCAAMKTVWRHAPLENKPKK